MSMPTKKNLLWLGISTIAFVTYTLTIGWYPRYFDIEWDEEVQLHDGQVIVVHVKNTYERLHREFGRYTSVIQRDTEISFETGSAAGRMKQLLKGGRPLILDQQDGIWFLVFSWSSHWSPHLLQGQNWGPDQNGNGQHIATLQGMQFKPVSICFLTDQFQQPNFLLRYADAETLSKFNGKLVTLRHKREYLDKYPLLYGDARIERPSAKSSTACQPPDQNIQGEKNDTTFSLCTARCGFLCRYSC